MNREERLRRELAGTGLQDRAHELAALPAAQVDLIARALRASGRAALDRDRQRRRQRRVDRRKYGHVEDPDYVAASVRVLGGLGRRAGSSLDALDALHRFIARDGPAVLAVAVDGLRAQGYSDGEIGGALGITRQAVGQRFGRKGGVHTGHAAGTPGRPECGPVPPPGQTAGSGAGMGPVTR
jgi:hypothetical protein